MKRKQLTKVCLLLACLFSTILYSHINEFVNNTKWPFTIIIHYWDYKIIYAKRKKTSITVPALTTVTSPNGKTIWVSGYNRYNMGIDCTRNFTVRDNANRFNQVTKGTPGNNCRSFKVTINYKNSNNPNKGFKVDVRHRKGWDPRAYYWQFNEIKNRWERKPRPWE